MKKPRIMIAGVSSGCGKTTAVCAVLSLLKRRNIFAAACKCGPDYIDPMFHRAVSGVPCTNLDPFFCDKNQMISLLCRSGGDMTVIEGAMGYYDGTGRSGTDNSAYTVASLTDTPVILAADAKGSAASLLAVIEGFLRFVPDSNIKGVLFNRMSQMNYRNVVRLMNGRFGESVVPVGYIPPLPEDCLIPSRHLGLVTADEIKDLSLRIEKTADFCEKTIDADMLISLAEKACGLDLAERETPVFEPIRLAAARDEAFCFYYDETLRLFERMGARISFFSPLANEPVPEGSDGLLLGGGYPELYADILRDNTLTRESVRSAVLSGMPTIAECGGFQYLGSELDGREMCGVLAHRSAKTERLVRFGYITVASLHDGLFGKAGTKLRAHEFHYYDSTDNGRSFRAEKPDGRTFECGVMTDTLYAGYPHLYLPAAPGAATAFYKKCLLFKENGT